jgi:ABC-type ATPase involved in cell division
MIEALTFRNFKGLRDVSLTLEPLTVFVGPNGSGKTTILEGVYYLAQCMTANPLAFFSGERDFSLLRTRNANDVALLSCDIGHQQFRIIASEPDEPPFELWKIDLNWRSGEQWPGPPPTVSAVFLQLNPKRLAAPSYLHAVKPTLASDGHGLASVLAFLSMNRPDAFRELQEWLRAVIPSVKRLRLDRVKVYANGETQVTTEHGGQRTVPTHQEYLGEVVLFDMESGATVPGQMTSAGTLLVVGILAAIFSNDSPSVLLLDDLDHGLHPKAQKELILVLRKLLAQRTDLQILATSHSPYLVDNFAPEEIRLTTLHQDGSVACAPMKDHPSFSKWKDAMSPGEFWSMVGEKWITRNETTEAAS